MTMRFPSLKFASTLQNCTETEILDGLEKIVRGEVVADGCALTKGKDVGEVVGAALQKMDKSNTVLVDLHESHANMLPVYAGAKQQDTATNQGSTIFLQEFPFSNVPGMIKKGRSGLL